MRIGTSTPTGVDGDEQVDSQYLHGADTWQRHHWTSRIHVLHAIAEGTVQTINANAEDR
ncbi:hypothetical protein [Corynebacterium stationis]|uniref:hypothetical protein n=1 Tax=Corynebacterium stationis TaxID=1705 RepID=UPI0012EB7E5E|nr:hypothetical protein [Corynebacterium stationis]